jgi:hypothetical protein
MNALMIELILGRSAHGKIVVLFRGTRVPKETMTVVDFSPVIQLKILDTGTIDTVHCQSHSGLRVTGPDCRWARRRATILHMTSGDVLQAAEYI